MTYLFPFTQATMTTNETSPADGTRAWSAFHDEDCAQWQVHDGSTVLATGIETEDVARKMAVAPGLAAALQEAKEYVENVAAFSGFDDGEAEMIDRWQKLLREANA